MNFCLTLGSPEPIYSQIVRQVRTAVALGRCPRGAKLPSIRELAGDLLVNPNTIRKAYTILTQEGVLESTSGAGTYMARTHRRQVDRDAAERHVEALADSLLTEAVHAGLRAEDVRALVRRRAAEFAFPEEKDPDGNSRASTGEDA